jgi:hypothetical protein
MMGALAPFSYLVLYNLFVVLITFKGGIKNCSVREPGGHAHSSSNSCTKKVRAHNNFQTNVFCLFLFCVGGAFCLPYFFLFLGPMF